MTTKQPPAQKHLEEKDRAAFEAWYANRYPNSGHDSELWTMHRESWQAALKSVVVEKSAPTSEGLAVTSSKSHTVTSSKTEPAVLVLPKEKDTDAELVPAFERTRWFGFNEALDAIKKLNTHLKTRVEGE